MLTLSRPLPLTVFERMGRNPLQVPSDTDATANKSSGGSGGSAGFAFAFGGPAKEAPPAATTAAASGAPMFSLFGSSVGAASTSSFLLLSLVFFSRIRIPSRCTGPKDGHEHQRTIVVQTVLFMN